MFREAAPRNICCEGLHASAAAVVLAAGMQRREIEKRNFLVVLDDDEEAGYFYHDLVQMRGEERVLFFPSTYRRAVKYAQRDAANEVLRTEVLNRLSAEPEGLMVVTFPEALAERVAPRQCLADKTVRLCEGETYDLSELEQRLSDLGFRRRDYVYEPGEFAVRGSILDVYSFSSEMPYRVDFFGDEVDSIRTFEVQTQLSRERLKEIAVVPDIAGSGGGLVPFTDYLPAGTVLVTKDLSFVVERIGCIYEEGFVRQAQEEAAEKLDKRELLADGSVLQEALQSLQQVRLAAAGHESEERAVLHFRTTPQPVYHKNFDLLAESLLGFQETGYHIYIAADSEKQHERLRSIFEEDEEQVRRGVRFTPVKKTLHAGFSDEDLQVCFFTDHQIFDRFHKYSLKSDRARGAKMALTLKEIMQFSVGDYIVHLDHGIGRFAGLVRVPAADGSLQEMIKLTYQNDDVVLVSIHSLHKLSKYKGREGEPPRMSKLGTGAWERMKEKTKSKLKDIARDLIRLYSRRQREKGFAFSHDTYMQHELEAGFAYEDTPDQLRVTQEIKADMERPRPMDRLVCGDVGFGKTEIAVRAALKAATDGKQVAVLVPTTVLALQHYKTFSSRLKDFPVRVDYLTRARTPKQVRDLLADLREGRVDIVVGTHKLIGKNVVFKDLGLLIIDEEQKFGVGVKEKLRQKKVNIDTLTMSATPIPRTLQFSLMGARDFSVIQTPPPNRCPIQTEVHVFSHEVIADAVNFEMSRNGQVFIVTNRISALANLKELLAKYVPDARVAVGHGQMPPAELEKIVLDFINYDYDVLVSTTIVENGIDIPNANTIIIDAAHRFGLSDLHQMRGRVGRSDRKAYCYLLAPPLSLLPDDARRRLQAIEEFCDLGSGIHLAMQDLDIRRAGNLLGAEQSGFIADLGYETYLKILNEAVAELHNEMPEVAEVPEATEAAVRPGVLSGELFVSECNVDCDLRAYFPETYVPGAEERMLLYRELDGYTTDEQLQAFRERMQDRFGPLPPEGEELLKIVPLRRLGRQVGAERIVLKQRRMTLYFVSKPDSPYFRSATFERVLRFATAHYRLCALKESGGKRRMVVSEVPCVDRALTLLQEIIA